jgi:hypothetical protein
MITIHDIEQGTPEWKELRSGKYTGTAADKLLRFGAVEDALTKQGSFGGNFHTKRGHILEDEAIEIYESVTGEHVARPGFVTNSDFPACGFSPDGLTNDTVIECKAFKPDKHMKIFNSKQAIGEIPREILSQIHFGMLMCGMTKAVLLVYNPDLDVKLAFRAVPILHNPKIAANFTRILSAGTLQTTDPEATL